MRFVDEKDLSKPACMIAYRNSLNNLGSNLLFVKFLNFLILYHGSRINDLIWLWITVDVQNFGGDSQSILLWRIKNTDTCTREENVIQPVIN